MPTYREMSKSQLETALSLNEDPIETPKIEAEIAWCEDLETYANAMKGKVTGGNRPTGGFDNPPPPPVI